MGEPRNLRNPRNPSRKVSRRGRQEGRRQGSRSESRKDEERQTAQGVTLKVEKLVEDYYAIQEARLSKRLSAKRTVVKGSLEKVKRPRFRG
jgi:hypothetical protein